MILQNRDLRHKTGHNLDCFGAVDHDCVFITVSRQKRSRANSKLPAQEVFRGIKVQSTLCVVPAEGSDRASEKKQDLDVISLSLLFFGGFCSDVCLPAPILYWQTFLGRRSISPLLYGSTGAFIMQRASVKTCQLSN